MKITEHEERNDNRRTFYSLNYGDVFVIEDTNIDKSYYLKIQGIWDSERSTTKYNAVRLNDNTLHSLSSGVECYRVNAELIIDTVYKNFLKK